MFASGRDKLEGVGDFAALGAQVLDGDVGQHGAQGRQNLRHGARQRDTSDTTLDERQLALASPFQTHNKPHRTRTSAAASVIYILYIHAYIYSRVPLPRSSSKTRKNEKKLFLYY